MWYKLKTIHLFSLAYIHPNIIWFSFNNSVKKWHYFKGFTGKKKNIYGSSIVRICTYQFFFYSSGRFKLLHRSIFLQTTDVVLRRRKIIRLYILKNNHNYGCVWEVLAIWPPLSLPASILISFLWQNVCPQVQYRNGLRVVEQHRNENKRKKNTTFLRYKKKQ